MPTYYVRRATEQTPGISDLEELGELKILKDGKSILPHLWRHDAVWNSLTDVETSSPELAAIKVWLETLVAHSSYEVNSEGLSQNRYEILWDESDSMMEVHEPNFNKIESIVRIYRIIFDLDHGLQALLLSKVLVKHSVYEPESFIVTRLETID